MDPSPRQSGSPATVMLVDDEEDLRTLMRLHLRRSGGHRVVAEAGDGAQAVELAGEHQPDIVLLDLMMPELDGRQALPQILRRSPRSMVVVLSALRASQEAEPAIAAGAFAYIEKTEIGPRFGDRIDELFTEFRRALDGETVVAPSALQHRRAGRPTS